MDGEENLINSLASFSSPMSGSKPQATEPMPFSLSTLTAQKAPAPELVEQKAGNITQAVENKKTNIMGRDALMQEVVRQDQGLAETIVDEFSPEGELIRAQRAAARQEVRRLERAQRSLGEALGDIGAGAIGGTGRLIEGAAVLNDVAMDAMDITHPVTRIGSGAAHAVGGFLGDLGDSLKSDVLNDKTTLSGLEKAVRAEESTAQYEADIEAGGNATGAALRRVGRDAVSAIQAGIDNPETAVNLVAENIPSLVVSAGGGALIARGTLKQNLLQKGASEEVAERFLKSERGQTLIRDTSIRLQPAIAGVQEAGGGGQEAGEAVDQLTEEQLIENSSVYREMRETMSHDEAKAAIREAVVFDSTLASGILGAALGNITKTFDAAPLAAGSVRKAGVNIVGENIQEGAMGAGGTLAQNISMRENADETQDILEDVGTATGEGMIAATGLTASAQAPGLAAGAGIRAFKGASDLTQKGVELRKAQVDRQIDADSATSDAVLAEASAPVYAAVDEMKASKELAGSPIMERINDTFEINAEEQAEINPQVKSIIQDDQGNIPVRRIDMVMALDQKFSDPKTSEEDKLLIASEINENVTVLFKLEDDTTNEFISTLEPTNENIKKYESMKQFLGEALQRPSIRDAITMLMENQIEEANIKEKNAQKRAEIIAGTAEVNPVNVSPQAGMEVLDLVRKRVIDLPESSVKALETAINISHIARLTHDAINEIDGKSDQDTRSGYTSKDVTKQIIELGWQGDRGEGKKSLVSHVSDIQALTKTGRLGEAKLALQNLTNFAETMHNKIKALDVSSKTGKSQTYKAWFPANQEWVDTAERGNDAANYGNAKLIVHPKNDRSFRLYRKIFAEASAAIAVQNTLASRYPELGITPIEMPKISQSVAQRQAAFNRKNLDALANFTSQINAQIEVENAQQMNQETVPAQEDAGRVDARPERDIEKEFDGLYEGEFSKRFKINPKTTSLIADAPSPIARVEELIAEGKPSTAVSMVKDKFLAKAPDLIAKMNKTLNDIINSDAVKRNIEKGKDIKQFDNLRSVVLTRKTDKGQEFDPRIAETAAIAGVSTALGLGSRGKVDVTSALEKQGIDFDGVPDQRLVDFMRDHTPAYQVVAQMSQATMRMMGIRPNPTVSEADSRGAFEALAHEVLAKMRDESIIDIVSETFSINGQAKQLSGIKIKEGFLDENQLKEMKKNSDLLSELIDPEGDKTFYVGKPPTKGQINQFQSRTGLPLREVQKRAIENQSKIPFTPNMPFLKIADAIGVEAMKTMRGYVEITDSMRSTYNANHLLSIEGKNQSIITEIEEVQAALERMSEYAGDNDLEFENTPIFFPAEITRVGRIQSVGPANGQSNKYARAALRSTWADLNLKDNPDHIEGFWRTVVQMSGVKVNGKKLEYLNSDEVINKGPEVIEQKYEKVLRELEKFYSDRAFNENIIANELFDTEPVVLEALSAVARLNIASDAERANFRHSVPLESDGVTNGPAAVLVKFSTGSFTVDQIKQFERIGLFFSDEKKTLADKSVEGDTYSVTADIAAVNVANRQKLLNQKHTKPYRDAVNRFIQKYNPDGINVQDQVEGAIGSVWELTRNAAKNPLTKTTYGAGKMGTARGIAGDAMDNFYKALTNYMQDGGGKPLTQSDFGYKELGNDLELLTKGHIRLNKEGQVYVKKTDKPIIFGMKERDYSKIGLNNDAFESLAENLNTVYVDPLYNAVTQTMGSSFASMQLFINAAQVQSAVLQAMFDEFMTQYENNTSYSPAEYKEWMDKFRALGAYIETEDQSFFVGGGVDSFLEASDGSGPRRIAGSLDRGKGRFSTGFRGSRPSLAGVSAGAYINIGTGDGLMMTLAMGNPIDGMDRVLQIFDGMEMPADKFRDIGEHMNKAAYDAWQAPTGKDVLKSFETFATKLNELGISPEAEKKVLSNINTDHTNINSVVSDMLAKLTTASDSMEARAKARASFSNWTDQMAGAGSSYHNKGSFAGSTHQEIAANLNNKLDDIKKPEKVTNITPNEKLTAEIYSLADEIDGVRTLEVSALRKLIKNMSTESGKYYQELIADNIPSDLQVVFGSPQSLENLRNSTFPLPDGVEATPMDMVSGQYDPNNNILYLVEDQYGNNIIGEAIMHELTHVVLHNKIDSYYNDGSLTAEERGAVERLNTLANQFIEMDFSKSDKATQAIVSDLRTMHQARGMDSKVLNEIVAEILTNPALIPVAKKTNNPLVQIAKAIINAIKVLFPKIRQPGLDYFSNALFNAEILVRGVNNPTDGTRDVMDKLRPTADRAAQTRNDMRAAVNQALTTMGLGNKELIGTMADAVDDMSAMSFQGFLEAGFTFNPQEAMIYRDIMNLFIVDAKMNGVALVRAQEVFDKVMEDLSVESFEPTSNNRYEAQEKYNAIIGLNQKLRKDSKGRSMILPSFLALASSNGEMSGILNQMAPPAKEKFAHSNTDETLASITKVALDTWTNAIIGESKGINAREAVENLVGQLANFDSEKQSTIEKMYQETYGMIDEKAGTALDAGATALAQKIDVYRKQIGNPIVALPLAIAQGAVSIFSKKEGAKRVEMLTKTMNTLKIPNFAVELVAELRGRTPENSKIYDMVNKVRFSVQSIREEFREQYPRLIQNEFTRKLSKKEWSAMHLGLGKTDVAALMDSFSLDQISQIFTSNSRRNDRINQLSKNLTKQQITKAKELANYMVNGKSSFMMMRNAYKIAEMNDVNQEKQIDDLISVLAIDMMPVEERKTVAELFRSENKGMTYSLAQMKNFRELEYLKNTNNPIVRLNQWKGHIPSEGAGGVSVILQNDSDHKRLVKMGYERVGSYKGQNVDYRSRGMSYYRTNVGSRNPYTQGVTQTVQASQNGIDIRTGRTVTGSTGGVITGPYVQTLMARMTQNPAAFANEHLLPVYAENGRVIAFERAIPPSIMKLKDKNTHFGEMIGAMGGRQIEEHRAREFNLELVKAVKEVYDNEPDRHDEYVNIATSKDPIHKDTWDNTIPRDMKDMLLEVFGEGDFFPVRKDMIPIVVGYRNAGPSDLWTGISRIPEPVQKTITETMTMVFGRNFYKRLMQASELWTGFVSEMKVLIVVKSIVVPAMNIASNVLQLTTKGVPLRNIGAVGSRKFIEINKYLENQNRGMELQAKMRATKNPIEIRKYQTQIENIKSANRRMTIWPLIEAGEFSTISEGLTDFDVHMKNGKFLEWVEGQAEKLPEGAKTLGRYALVSKSTSMYKGLHRATQYGDFLAKAILYDDMVNRRGMNQAEALGQVTEEFVNYNIPAGRSRTFLENFGLAWFQNFKIRSVKPALRVMRENPLRAMMGMLAVQQSGFLGSPMTDNIVSTIYDGRFDYSLGIGMGLRAPSLNPWYALING